MKIGLALSGGGFRASIFHCGLLARLALENQLENVEILSTVSGGSLVTGLIFSENNLTWPTSDQFITDILPKVRTQFTTNGLRKPLLMRQLRKVFTIFETRADDVSVLLRERWGMEGSLDQLPGTPRWMINATCYETGKNWRFERFRMGDYQFGYTNDTHYPLAEAVAASAALPALIGPLVFNTAEFSWFQYLDESEELKPEEAQLGRKTRPIQPEFSNLHLWDGGVYDNLGLEGLHDFRKGWPKVDFLIVSDASGTFKNEKYRRGPPALMRMATGIMKNQIRSLQSRTVLERIIDHSDRGSYLRTGNDSAGILTRANKKDEIETLCAQSLSAGEAKDLADLPTDIAAVSPGLFDLLFRHGFEVADTTMYAFNQDLFKFIGFQNTRWF
ncbi:MAG: patatin-like phospholipase family protein [Anaerolineales bacterium]|nr:patatin-like phospholipase family protein [Anaerolineales bacterium]